jgi:WD40 repeat protein
LGPQLWHRDGVLFASFSPDCKRIVTAGEDHDALVWDIATGRRLTHALQHGDEVETAAFSPDGSWIVTASDDHTARVWEAATGEPLTPPLRHLRVLEAARFLPDGRQILVEGSHGNVWIWQFLPDMRSVEDLRKIAYLLSGEAFTSSDAASINPSESPWALWRKLQSEYPDTFKTSPRENYAWHEFEAEQSAIDQQWYATAFHLEQLLSVDPGNESLLKRLAKAKQHLKAGE